MEHYAIFDTATGIVQSRSIVPDGTVAGLELPEGLGVVVMDPISFAGLAADDLGPLKLAVTNQVNTAAGQFRKQFITDVPGQQATYLAKEAEAKAWTPGADPAGFPYLAAEAAATGQAVAYVAALVLATAERWRALDPLIEGRRRGAAVAIEAAGDIAAIVAAGLIDWSALIAPAAPEAQPAADPVGPAPAAAAPPPAYPAEPVGSAPASDAS